MKKKILVSGAAMVIALSVTGCASTSEQPAKQYGAESSFDIIIPAKNPNTDIAPTSLADITKYFILPSTAGTVQSGNSAYRLGQDFSLKGSNQFSAFRFQCQPGTAGQVCNPFARSTVSIDGAVDYKVEGDSIRLHVAPKEQTTSGVQLLSYIGAGFKVTFEPTDLLNSFKYSYIDWSFEIDSEYPDKAILANFARLSDKTLRTGEMNSDIQKFGNFGLKVAGTYFKLDVKAYPYHSGSKIIIKARVPGRVKGKIVDFSQNTDLLKEKIEQIVKA